MQVRDSIFEAGDFIHEPNDMAHGETMALEDPEYLSMSDGPIFYLVDDKFSGYLGWKQLQRMKEAAT